MKRETRTISLSWKPFTRQPIHPSQDAKPTPILADPWKMSKFHEPDKVDVSSQNFYNHVPEYPNYTTIGI